MRSLATLRAEGPIYRYVESREDLLDGIVEVALSELKVESSRQGDWRQHLREHAYGFRRLALAHREVFPSSSPGPWPAPLPGVPWAPSGR